jgi:prepilin-type processing-associated H-X9-DG protein
MGLPETKVLSPSDMLMFLDCVAVAIPPRMRNDSVLMFTNFPHNGSINVSYCDGHVDSLRQRELVAIPDNIKIKYNNDHLAQADTW